MSSASQERQVKTTARLPRARYSAAPPVVLRGARAAAGLNSKEENRPLAVLKIAHAAHIVGA
jgi:hypothetical protein